MNTREKDDRLSVHKDTKRGTWYVKIKYTDWTGEKKETTRRGFAKKKDALLFEQDFHRQKKVHLLCPSELYMIYTWRTYNLSMLSTQSVRTRDYLKPAKRDYTMK